MDSRLEVTSPQDAGGSRRSVVRPRGGVSCWCLVGRWVEAATPRAGRALAGSTPLPPSTPSARVVSGLPLPPPRVPRGFLSLALFKHGSLVFQGAACLGGVPGSLGLTLAPCPARPVTWAVWAGGGAAWSLLGAACARMCGLHIRWGEGLLGSGPTPGKTVLHTDDGAERNGQTQVLVGGVSVAPTSWRSNWTEGQQAEDGPRHRRAGTPCCPHAAVGPPVRTRVCCPPARPHSRAGPKARTPPCAPTTQSPQQRDDHSASECAEAERVLVSHTGPLGRPEGAAALTWVQVSTCAVPRGREQPEHRVAAEDTLPGL